MRSCLIPCQVIRTGRKLVLRVLGWNPHLIDLLSAGVAAASVSTHRNEVGIWMSRSATTPNAKLLNGRVVIPSPNQQSESGRKTARHQGNYCPESQTNIK